MFLRVSGGLNSAQRGVKEFYLAVNLRENEL